MALLAIVCLSGKTSVKFFLAGGTHLITQREIRLLAPKEVHLLLLTKKKG